MVFSIKSIQEIWYQLLSQFSHFLSLGDQKLDLFNQGSLKAMSKSKFHFYIYLGTIQVLNFQTVQCAPLVQMHILFFFFFFESINSKAFVYLTLHRFFFFLMILSKMLWFYFVFQFLFQQPANNDKDPMSFCQHYLEAQGISEVVVVPSVMKCL